MKTNLVKTIALLAAALAAANSCSIKEARDVCPSRVYIHVDRQNDEVLKGSHTGYFYSWQNGRLVEHKELSDIGLGAADIEFMTERGMLHCLVTNRELDGDRYVVSPGEQFIDLWSSVCTIDCTGDEASYSFGPFDKQYCDIILHLSRRSSGPVTKGPGEEPSGEDSTSADGIGILFRSPWNGIMAVPDPSNPDKPYAIEAAAGEFRYRTEFDSTGTAGVRVSRQGGPGLEAVITFPDGRDYVLDLYQYMEEACYDWYADSLDDFEGTLLIEPVTGECLLIDWRTIEVDVIHL